MVQLVSLAWSYEVGVGRQGCCTSLLHLHGLALEDGEVVRRGWSRAGRALMIITLTWPETGDRVRHAKERRGGDRVLLQLGLVT